MLRLLVPFKSLDLGHVRDLALGVQREITPTANPYVHRFGDRVRHSVRRSVRRSVPTSPRRAWRNCRRKIPLRSRRTSCRQRAGPGRRARSPRCPFPPVMGRRG